MPLNFINHTPHTLCQKGGRLTIISQVERQQYGSMLRDLLLELTMHEGPPPPPSHVFLVEVVCGWHANNSTMRSEHRRHRVLVCVVRVCYVQVDVNRMR